MRFGLDFLILQSTFDIGIANVGYLDLGQPRWERAPTSIHPLITTVPLHLAVWIQEGRGEPSRKGSGEEK